MMQLPNGHTLQSGKYQLTEMIGQGGFGITYLGVWNTEVKGELGRVKTAVPVCIKEYFFKDYCFRDEKSLDVQIHSEVGRKIFEKFKEKLIKEATILSDVHHPYIVNVLEVFEEHQTAYIAMEYIEGCSLKYMLDQRGVLPESSVLKYVAQIGQALDFVHKKSIVHLDIKPSNILIDKRDTARLIDFGVSKRYDIEQQETSTTMLALSKGFASIEQYDDEGTAVFSPCPDIYSLGATMYNLLSGEIPTESILRATKSLVHPTQLNKELSAKTEEVILKAMNVKPSARYQSVSEMMNQLDLPSYFEENSNLMIESFKKTLPAMSTEGEETDLVVAPSKRIDDDQTVLATSSSKEVPQVHRKRWFRSRVGLFLLVLFFSFSGYALLSFFKHSRLEASNEHGSIIHPKRVAEIRNTTVTTPPKKVVAPTQNNRPAENVEKETNSTNSRSQRTTIERTPVVKTPTVPPSPPQEEAITEVLSDAAYNQAMETGNELIKQARYAEARATFEEIKKSHVTEEVLRLIIFCDKKIEEDEIIKRKALYEEKIPFGELMIVKNKSNGRYGAIDAQGRERVKCVYLSVAPSHNGRAFEREDHLYDIYNNKGINVGQGLTNY